MGENSSQQSQTMTHSKSREEKKKGTQKEADNERTGTHCPPFRY